MNSQYQKLIALAEETDTASTPEKVKTLNHLLSTISVSDIEPDHLALLDDLICILSNTGNLLSANEAVILQLLEEIRSKTSS